MTKCVALGGRTAMLITVWNKTNFCIHMTFLQTVSKRQIIKTAAPMMKTAASKMFHALTLACIA
jgi:hypothetical protein